MKKKVQNTPQEYNSEDDEDYILSSDSETESKGVTKNDLAGASSRLRGGVTKRRGAASSKK